MRSVHRLLALAALMLTLALPASSGAADAVRGKALFFNTNGAPQSCGSAACHAGFPAVQAKGIAKGANPALTLDAIAKDKGGMGALAGYVNAADAADIAAYIANPAAANGSPAIALSATNLAFAAQTVGTTSAAQTVTVSNAGTAPLTIASLTLSGVASGDFVRSGTCTAGGSVAAGGRCSIAIAFAPAAAGSRNATLTIAHNASAGSSVLTLSGTGNPTAAAASLSPVTLGFTQMISTVSAPQTVTLSNTGGQPLTLGTIALAGASAAEYALAAASTCAAGAVVNGGASCVLQVTFAPTAAGARNATLSIAHSAAASPATVALNGTGTLTPQAAISLSAAALDFGSQSVGTSSAAKSLTVTNSGQAPLALGTLTLGGGAAADFARAGSCAAGATVAPGATCAIQLTFVPTAVGTRSASLTVASNAVNGAATVALSGAAVHFAISVNPTAATMQTMVGDTSDTLRAEVANSGSSPLTVASIAVSGPFLLQPGSNACGSGPMVLSPNQSCNVYVAFQPTGAGAAAGEVLIMSDASASPTRIALSAQAMAEPTSANASVGGSASNVGLGGCSIGAPDQLVDPTLALMAAAAVFGLRRRAPAARR